jgi:hypothetical protein
MLRAALHYALARNRYIYWTRPDGQAARLDYTNADEVGQMLLDENVASVQHRYPTVDLTTLPGKVDCEWLVPYKHVLAGRLPTLVEALKLLDCYEYQSCEHLGWDTSQANLFCRGLRSVLIHALPGYDEAPWGWTERDETRQVPVS